jgi:hypothetical protein
MTKNVFKKEFESDVFIIHILNGSRGEGKSRNQERE